MATLFVSFLFSLRCRIDGFLVKTLFTNHTFWSSKKIFDFVAIFINPHTFTRVFQFTIWRPTSNQTMADHENDTEDEFDSSSPFPVGTVVWAGLDGFPIWPSRIVSKYQVAWEGVKKRVIPPHKCICLFFNDNDRFSLIEKSKIEVFNPEDDEGNKRRAKTRKYGRDIAEASRQAIEFIDHHRPPKNMEVAQRFLERQAKKKGSAAASSSDAKKVNVAKRGPSSRVERESRESVNEGKGNPRKRRKTIHPLNDDDDAIDINISSKDGVDRNEDFPNKASDAEINSRPPSKSQPHKRPKKSTKRIRSSSNVLKDPSSVAAPTNNHHPISESREGHRKKASSKTAANPSTFGKKRPNKKAAATSPEEYEDDHRNADINDEIHPQLSSPPRSPSRKKHRHPPANNMHPRHSHGDFSKIDVKKRRGKRTLDASGRIARHPESDDDERVAVAHSRKGRPESRHSKRAKDAEALSENESDSGRSHQSSRSLTPRRKDDHQTLYSNGVDNVHDDNKANRSPVVLGVGNDGQPRRDRLDDRDLDVDSPQAVKPSERHGYSSSDEYHGQREHGVNKRSPVDRYEHQHSGERLPSNNPSDGERTEDSSGNDDQHHHHHRHHRDEGRDRDLDRDHDHGHDNERERDDRDYDRHHDGDHDPDIDIGHHDQDPNRDRDSRSFPHVDEDRPPPPTQTDDDDGEDTIDDDDNEDMVQRNVEDDTTNMVNKTDAVINPEGAETEDDDDGNVNNRGAQVGDKGIAEMDPIREECNEEYESDSERSIPASPDIGQMNTAEGRVLYHGLDCVPDSKYIRPYKDLSKEELIHLLVTRDELLSRNSVLLWQQSALLRKDEVLENEDSVRERCEESFALARKLIDFVENQNDKRTHMDGNETEGKESATGAIREAHRKEEFLQLENVLCSVAHKLSDTLFTRNVNISPILNDLISVTKDVGKVSVRAAVAFRDIACLWLDLMKLWKRDPELEDPREDDDSVDGDARDPDAHIESDSGHEDNHRAGESPLTPKDREFGGLSHGTPTHRHGSPSDDDVDMADRSTRREDEPADGHDDEHEDHSDHLNQHDSVHRDRDVDKGNRTGQRRDSGSQMRGRKHRYDSYSDYDERRDRHDDADDEHMEEDGVFRRESDSGHEMNDSDLHRNHHDEDDDQSVENREESDADADVLKSVLEDEEARQARNDVRTLEEERESGVGDARLDASTCKADNDMSAAGDRIMSDREDGKSAPAVDTKPMHGITNHRQQAKTDEKSCTMKMKYNDENENDKSANNENNDDDEHRLGRSERIRETRSREEEKEGYDNGSPQRDGRRARENTGDRGGRDSQHRERSRSTEHRGSKDRRRGSGGRRGRGRGDDGSRSPSASSRGSGSDEKRRRGESRFSNFRRSNDDESRPRNRSPRPEGRTNGSAGNDRIGSPRLHGSGGRGPAVLSAPPPPTPPPTIEQPGNVNGDNGEEFKRPLNSRQMDEAEPRMNSNPRKGRRNSGTENESPNLQGEMNARGSGHAKVNGHSNNRIGGDGGVPKKEKVNGSAAAPKKPRLSSSSLPSTGGPKERAKENGVNSVSSGPGGSNKLTGERKAVVGFMKQQCDLLLQDTGKKYRKEIACAFEEACWTCSGQSMDMYRKTHKLLRRTIQVYLREREQPVNGAADANGNNKNEREQLQQTQDAEIARTIDAVMRDGESNRRDVAMRLVELCLKIENDAS